MKKLLLALLFLATASCAKPLIIGENAHYEATMITTQGDIRLTLFNDTPIHRDNFAKLVQEGFYNDLLFHRVIEGFVIQAGNGRTRSVSDSVSNENPQRVTYTGDNLDYTIPPEIQPHYFHKKGVLATARMGDDVNPGRNSSGTQFYIVLGKVQSDSTLQVAATQIAERGGEPLTSEREEIYKTEGGTPRLDGSYTIFGEVIGGMEVAEKINQTPTDATDRPQTDILIKDIRLEVVCNK